MLSIKGIYDGKNIKPLETFTALPNSEVIITFIEKKKDQSAKKIDNLLDLCGSWKDDRSPEEIIDDIYKGRTSRNRELEL